MRGAGEAGAGEAGEARAGRGDAGAELLSRAAAPAPPRAPPRDASSRSASCSSEPSHVRVEVLTLHCDSVWVQALEVFYFILYMRLSVSKVSNLLLVL